MIMKRKRGRKGERVTEGGGGGEGSSTDCAPPCLQLTHDV